VRLPPCRPAAACDCHACCRGACAIEVTLGQGSNTRFAEWLPHDDIRVTDFTVVARPELANPKAIKPGGPPVKVRLNPKPSCQGARAPPIPLCKAWCTALHARESGGVKMVQAARCSGMLPHAGPARRLPHAGPARRLPHAGPARRLPHAGPARRLPHAGPARRLPHAGPARRVLTQPVTWRLARRDGGSHATSGVPADMPCAARAAFLRAVTG